MFGNMECGPETLKNTETNTALQFDGFVLPLYLTACLKERLFLLRDFRWLSNFFGNNLDSFWPWVCHAAEGRCPRTQGAFCPALLEDPFCHGLMKFQYHWLMCSWITWFSCANEFQTFLPDGFDNMCGMSGEAILAIVNSHWKIRCGCQCATWCNGATSISVALFCTAKNLVSANVANARFRELRSVGFLRRVTNNGVNGVVMFEIETFEIKHDMNCTGLNVEMFVSSLWLWFLHCKKHECERRNIACDNWTTGLLKPS